jgi:hypothetical protein
MPRLDGDVFFFGTAMAISLNETARHAPNHQNVREAGLIKEASRQG